MLVVSLMMCFVIVATYSDLNISDVQAWLLMHSKFFLNGFAALACVYYAVTNGMSLHVIFAITETQVVSLYRGWTLPQSGPTLVNTQHNTTVRLRTWTWTNPYSPQICSFFFLQKQLSCIGVLGSNNARLRLSSLSHCFVSSLPGSCPASPLVSVYLSLFPFSVYPHYFYR